MHGLFTMTVRPVALGVVGVAFIQALLVGISLAWAGIPAPGVLAVVLVFTGIARCLR